MCRSGVGRVALASVLDGEPANAELVPLAVATARSLPLARAKAGDLPTRLLRIAADAKHPAELRLERRWPPYPADSSSQMIICSRSCSASSTAKQTVAKRTTAADVLARARLTPAQLARLADALRSAGPVEVDRLLAAFEQSTDESHSA